MTPLELFGASECGLCGEKLRMIDEVGEFYNPTMPDVESVIAHAQCGFDAGWELA